MSVEGIEDEEFPCPCCGFFTLDEKPPGTYDICPLCGWEDDPVQHDDPTYRGGANHESLIECRLNFFTSSQAMALVKSKLILPTGSSHRPKPSA